MKTREILLGRSYTNGKGKVRKIIAEGEHFGLYVGQSDTDCVRYRVIEHVHGDVAATESNMTRNAFAAWAKTELVKG